MTRAPTERPSDHANFEAPQPGSWLLLTDPFEIFPVDDIKIHTSGLTCQCFPDEEDGVIIHVSYDHREEFGFSPIITNVTRKVS